MAPSPSSRIPLSEATLRWGASLAGLWLVGAAFLLALAYRAAEIELAWSIKLYLLGSLGLGSLTWVVFAIDKRRAVHRESRISEATLHALTLLGGWWGAFLAQRWLRHKSQRFAFQLTAWLGLLLHALAALVTLGWL
jgi:uncharacterized membrane protein YsdA (DUF1294 family)